MTMIYPFADEDVNGERQDFSSALSLLHVLVTLSRSSRTQYLPSQIVAERKRIASRARKVQLENQV